MKKIILSFLFLTPLGLSACGDNKTPEPGGGAPDYVDQTTDCKSPVEKGSYTTFYKPAIGWFGDPIPFSDNGKFYIFYLQDWRSNFPYLHPWHMVSSTDLSSFTFEGETIPCGNATAQDVALGTGGVIKSRENGKYYAFYTGHKWNPEPGMPIQGVMLTTSPDLKNWTKDNSFMLFINGEGYDRNEFRDPHVYYDEEAKVYKMLVSAKRNNQAVLALLTSTDLHNWTQQAPFYTDNTGAIMLECADVFKMGEYWYMTYSNVRDRKVHYRYGKSQDGPWITPPVSAFDGIAFYAGKTMSNGTDRYLVGWCPTRIGNDGAEDQWGGSMVCHRMIANPDGTLRMAIPAGVDQKFSKPVKIQAIAQSGNVQKRDNSFTLSGESRVTLPRIKNQGKIETTVIATGTGDIFGFEFGACDSNDEVHSIRFDLGARSLSMYKETPGKAARQTEVSLSVPANLIFNIKVVTEKSVCVIYVNDAIAFTNRIDRISQNPWRVFSKQGENIIFSNVNFFEN